MFQIDLRTYFFFNSDGSKTNYIDWYHVFLIFGKMADFQPAMDLYVFSGKLDSTMHFVSKKKWAFFVPCYQQEYSPLKLKYCTWFTWISNVVTLTGKGTNPKCSIHASYGVTHLKFKIAPEKWWLEDYFPIGKVSFQGLCYTFGGVFGFSKTSGPKIIAVWPILSSPVCAPWSARRMPVM